MNSIARLLIRLITSIKFKSSCCVNSSCSMNENKNNEKENNNIEL